MAGFSVDAVVMNQNGVELYLFAMNSADLRRICYVTPRSTATPKEIQRIVNDKRARAIGEFIQEATSLLPSSIVVSFDDDVTVTETQQPSIRVLSFPASEGKFGYILDGQHRLEGFKYSNGIEFDLPVVALHTASETLRVKVFADINSKQVPATKVALAALYHQIKALDADDAATMDVVLRLNASGVLKDKVKTLDDQKGRWITNVALAKLIAPHVTPGGELAKLDIANQAQILNEYLSAIRATWPVEWEDRVNYNLSQPLGFEMMLRVLPRVMYRVRLVNGKAFTAKNFAKQLEPLNGATLDIAGLGDITLDWVKGTMGFFASAAARKALGDAILDELAEE